MAMDTLQPGASPANPAPRVPPAPSSFARRAVLGALAASPLAAISLPALAAPSSDEWQAIVHTYRERSAEWLVLDRAHDELRMEWHRRKPAKPVEPGSPPFHNDMTLNEILALSPREGWREYEEELAEWKRQCAALKEQIAGPAEAAADEALDRHVESLAALKAYPAATPQNLAEKVEILIAEYGDEDNTLAQVLTDLRGLSGEARS